MKFVYVASPYTKGDVAVNVRLNIGVADELAQAGFFPFAPLLTHFWHLLHPHPYEFWCAHDNAWIERCDCLVRLPGDSTGADREVELARAKGVPVYHVSIRFQLDDFQKWVEWQTYCKAHGIDPHRSLYSQMMYAVTPQTGN
jgi:hypothetical protein